MTTAAFDILTTARDLEAVGVEHRQAEAGAVRQAVSADRGEFATKADLRTATEPLATKAALYRGISALRSEMRWMFGLQAALILAMAAKLFGIVCQKRPSTARHRMNREQVRQDDRSERRSRATGA